MPNDNLKSYLHLHFIVFVWGFTAVLGKLISLDALPLVWFRMLLAVGFILIYIGFNKTSLQKKYGKAGFSSLSNIILNDIKSSSPSFSNMELETKKLN